MDVLPDVLQPGLRVVFCGTAAGRKSAQVGAYYAGPGNAFWRTLHRVGLTPHQIAPAAFRTVTGYGIGLTDVAKRAAGSDADLPAGAFDAAALRAKLLYYAPGVVAFTSKRAAREFFGRRVEYGLQAETVGPVRAFVLPSPSGAARRYWDESVWQALADFVMQM